MTTSLLSPRFNDAFLLAAELHRTQTRKGTQIPYVSHLMSVAALVLEYGGDEDQSIAGLLHDSVEDQGGAPTLERVRTKFGDRVARIVEACTDTDVVPKPPWEARKRAYIEHLRTTPPEALLVSACDKLHNARSLVADVREHGVTYLSRFTGTPAQTCWYYRSLVEVFRARGIPSGLLRELELTVAQLERLVAG